MGEPVTTLMVIAGVAKGGQMLLRTQESQAESMAVKLKAKEERLRYQQETIESMDLMKSVLDRQIAQATTRGVSLSSPSLQAIQVETLRKGGQRLKTQEIEHSLAETNLKIEKKNVKSKLYTSLFGDIADIGLDFAKYAGAK